MTLGRKELIITSVVCASRRTIARAASVCRSSVTLRLPRLRA